MWGVEAWTGLLWLKIGTSGGRLEWNVVNEPSGSIKCGEFRD